jgi:membrane protein required for colicin V production
MSQFAVIDIVFVVLIIILIVRAGVRGFVAEVFSMAALVCGILAGFFFYKNGAAFIRTKLPDLEEVQVLPEVLSFAVLFVISFVVIKLLEYLIKDLITRIKLGGLDHFLGVLVGFAEGEALAMAVLFVIHRQPLFEPASILSGSFFDRYLAPFIESAVKSLG